MVSYVTTQCLATLAVAQCDWADADWEKDNLSAYHGILVWECSGTMFFRGGYTVAYYNKVFAPASPTQTNPRVQAVASFLSPSGLWTFNFCFILRA
jgi:hypothetical protein